MPATPLPAPSRMIAGLPHLRGLSEVISAYDAIICDVWGVLHNGVNALPGAPEALVEARRHAPVLLLTNAPRPPRDIVGQLAGFSVGPQCYDAIVSSGGVTRDLLGELPITRFYHLGPERNAPVFEGLAPQPAPLEAAELVLCSGLFDDNVETAEDYRPLLTQALARRLPMICANPDLIVERGHQMVYCAGAIAALYEEMGGEVTWVGKPRPLVYDRAMAALAGLCGRNLQRERVLCIGDAIRTDVAGAISAGFPCLMTIAGIHAAEAGISGDLLDEKRFGVFLDASAVRPTMTMVSLTW